MEFANGAKDFSSVFFRAALAAMISFYFFNIISECKNKHSSCNYVIIEATIPKKKQRKVFSQINKYIFFD